MIPKFRAWHKIERKMCAVDTLTQDGAFLIGVEPKTYFFEDREKVRRKLTGRFCPHKDIILMQWSELKDSENIYIFKNDIIVINGAEFNNGTMPVSVKFHNGAFRDSYFGWSIGLYISQTYNKIRIIGNIHQSEGLLK